MMTPNRQVIDEAEQALFYMRRIFAIISDVEQTYGAPDNGDDDLYELIYIAAGSEKGNAPGILRHYEAILKEQKEQG